uniref:DUF4781 domain-containing protein n=1 Tax=Panagrolaimus sp. ES5 TaxID=591445 RepID=A0AC34FQB0_9BILA
MGNNFTKEHLSTWNEDDVQQWKTKAIDILKVYYLAFSGREFDNYNPETDILLLRAKICYALFGLPEVAVDRIEDAYNENQKIEAQKIVDVILKVRSDAGINELSVGILVICCKKEGKEFPLPIFRIYTGQNCPPKYVDTQCRIYDNWNDWEENNCLPIAVERLIDKGNHGESLTDFESVTLWISIAATPLHFISSIANAQLATGAAQGRIFSSSTRIFATVLNCTTLGVDGIMLGFGLTNLIEKIQNDKLEPLDVLQFSMSVFFFSHTLMQPVTAKAVIQNAQNQHIQKYLENMNDADTQAAFKSFLERNRGDGDMIAHSKVIRTLNRMDDPKAFFKGVGKDAVIDIGGRKGKTLLVKDAHNRTNRINPNRTFFDTKTQYPVTIQKLQKIQKCLDGKTLDQYELNGRKIFQNLNDRQKGRIGKVLGGAARYKKEIVDASGIIATALNIQDADNFMSIIEIVATDVQGL